MSAMAEFSSRLHAQIEAQTAAANERIAIERKKKSLHKKAEKALAKEKELVK